MSLLAGYVYTVYVPRTGNLTVDQYTYKAV